MTNSAKQTLDQHRASDALAKIRGIAAANKNDGMYISYASALPATIVMNGLGQALAMEMAKANKDKPHDSHLAIYQHVAGWLSKQVPSLTGDVEKFLDRLMDGDQATYVHAQVEAMAYLNWLKHFARAFLMESKESGND